MSDDLDTCATAWKAGDPEPRAAAARRLGIALDDAAATALATALERANGRRRALVLSHADVLRTILEARDSPHGIAVRHAGSEPQNKTSLCLAVTQDGGVVVGIGECWGDRPTPGRIWKQVGPWQQDFARNREKADAWAREAGTDRALVPLVPLGRKPRAKARPACAGDQLLAEVLAHPDDDAPRLVYADYLTEQGDPRGELITVQCAIATTPPPERATLVAREEELLRKHGRIWRKDAEQVVRTCELRRGFVASVTATAAAFVTHGAALLAREPIEELVLSHPNPKGLQQLAAAPQLARIRILRFWHPMWMKSQRDLRGLRALLDSPHNQLRELAVSADCRAFDGIGELFANVQLPVLESLNIDFTGPDAAPIFEGLATAKLPALRELATAGRELDALRRAFPSATLS